MTMHGFFKRDQPKGEKTQSKPPAGANSGGVRGNLSKHRENPGTATERQSLSLVKGNLEQQRSSSLGAQVAQQFIAEKGIGELKAHPDQIIAIHQPGYARGDQFGIAAALIHNPNAHLFISKGCPSDHSEGILKFYASSQIDPKRITIVDVGHARDKAEANDLLRKVADGYRSEIEKQIGVKLDSDRHLLGLDETTRYVGQVFDSQNVLRDKIRTAWKIDDSRDPEIQTWLQQKGVHLETGDKVAILWSRFSGSKGNAHLEHDTSFTGMQQIISRMPEGYKIVIAGDLYKDPGDRTRYDEMVKQSNGKVINLTEFWKDPSSASWGGNDRVEQFRLYDYLHRNHQLKHLGFRSGNLETLALIGHEVRYMEEPLSSGSTRMKAWNDTPIGYNRFEVERVPTLTGQLHKMIARRHKKTIKLAEKFERLAEKSPGGVLKPLGKLPLKIARKFERGKMLPKWAPGVYHKLDRKERLMATPGLVRLKLYKRIHSQRRGFTENDLKRIRAYFES